MGLCAQPGAQEVVRRALPVDRLEPSRKAECLVSDLVDGAAPCRRRRSAAATASVSPPPGRVAERAVDGGRRGLAALHLSLAGADSRGVVLIVAAALGHAHHERDVPVRASVSRLECLPGERVGGDLGEDPAELRSVLLSLEDDFTVSLAGCQQDLAPGDGSRSSPLPAR
jgi:hypothetical protein